MNRLLRRSTSRGIAKPSTRSGSTLLIVVALIGMLMFLGFIFYTFASQERTNAVNQAQGAKAQALNAPAAQPDDLFDFALRSIIIGPSDDCYQSVLWGGRHSLLANMYGRDGILWNGEGVSLNSNAGQPFVDMDNDGTANITANGLNQLENQNLLNPVDSPVANIGAWNNGSGTAMWGTGKQTYLGSAINGPFNPLSSYIPQPDVNYNSPDINSMFLSYDGFATDATGATRTRVVIPSYLRPQYLRINGSPNPTWYNSAPANQVMRPHPNHYCVDSSGNVLTLGGQPIPRYVSLADPVSYKALGLRRPFTSNAFLPETAAGNPSTGYLGVWSGAANPNPQDISADVDTDGDGVMDAILMDLGFPPIRRSDDKYVVPLFAIRIRDLNGLINVNASGNLAGNLNLNTVNANNQLGFRPVGAASPTGYVADNLSKSNQGLSTNEINPQRALTALPADVRSNSEEVSEQVAYFLSQFDSSMIPYGPGNTNGLPARSVPELANTEWMMFNVGRPQFNLGLLQSGGPITAAISNLIPGRNGEYLSNASPTNTLNFLATYTTNGALYMPRAGESVSAFAAPNWVSLSADDNNNYNEGESNYPTRWVNPLDFRGSGLQFRRMGLGADGKPGKADVDDDGNGIIDDYLEAGWLGSDDPQTLSAPVKNPMMMLSNGALLWPAYSGYHSYGTVQWGEPASTSYSAKLMTNQIWYSQLDDPQEAVYDPVLMSPAYSGSQNTVFALTGGSNSSLASVSNSIQNDKVFGPQEMLFLQGSSQDIRQADTQSRMGELMPANLVAASNSADIRRRLTTVSTDRREAGFGINPVGQLRAEGIAAPTPYVPWESFPQFPPDALYASSPNPYRNELYYYLTQALTSIASQSPTYASASLKLDVNRLLYLNSAGTQYGFVPLPQQTSISDQSAVTARQYMARDIYTLLYTLCQGQDTDYRTSQPPTSAEAKEMAQFAINLVDSLDTDNIITAFYYDEDLTQAGGGWTQAAATNVVYGVERQLLTFTEAMSFRVLQQTTNDSGLTIFDDKTTGADGRRYAYFELQNVTPMNVPLASTGVTSANATTNADWRVRLQNYSDPNNPADLNVLYFLHGGLDQAHNYVTTDGNGNKVLTPGQTFTVSSQDGTDTFSNNATGTYRSSDFRMSNNGMDGNFSLYVPSIGVNNQPDGVGGRTTPPKASTDSANFPVPNCNLDLVWDGYGGVALPSTRFYLSNGNGTAGSFVSGLTKAMTNIRFVLERRAADGSANGVWVTVDATTSVSVGSITPPDPAVNGGATTAMQNLTSYPRSAPLQRTSETPLLGSSNLNNAPSASGTAWQWQPDRDFASLGELLLLPLYGPDVLTDGRISTSEFYLDAIKNKYYPTSASARFLRPDNPDMTLNGTVPNNGNRWYRLLSLLEVQNRGHQHPGIRGISTTNSITWGSQVPLGIPATFGGPQYLGSTSNPSIPLDPSTGLDNFPLPEPFYLPQYFGWPKTHGLINLNMIRDPQVLAALIDDDSLINDPRFSGLIDPRFTNQSATFSLHATDEASRMWWVEFLKSRESRATLNFTVDPVTNLYVPGTGSARPFRGFDSLAVTAKNPVDSPLENTILRSLPLDYAGNPNPNESRRLLEVGLNNSEHFGPIANEATNVNLHPNARYQVLSKLMNNTTTRSNSFAVFVTVQYYEAAEVPTDTAGVTAYRIGGQLTDTAPNRAFFVVDRAGVVEQMKILTQNGLSPVSQSGTYSFAPNTDTSGKRINMNGIRWKDLVLFRQILN